MGADLPPRPEDVGLSDDWLVVAPAIGQTMWRMIKHDQATRDDFCSDRLRGRPRFSEDLEVDHLGLSMFADVDQARSMMRRFPKYIAAVRLEAGHGLSLARTLPELDGHHTVWGLPEDLAELVESVFIEEGQ